MSLPVQMGVLRGADHEQAQTSTWAQTVGSVPLYFMYQCIRTLMKQKELQTGKFSLNHGYYEADEA